MGISHRSKNTKAAKKRGNPVHTKVIRKLRKTTPIQSQAIPGQQHRIEKLTRKPKRNDIDTLDEEGNTNNFSHRQSSQSMTSKLQPSMTEDSAEGLFKVSINGKDARVMILSEDMIADWNTILSTKVKIKALYGEIKPKCDVVERLAAYRDDERLQHNWRYDYDLKERFYGNIPESKLQNEYNTALWFGRALFVHVDALEASVEKLIGKFAEVMDERLEKSGLQEREENDEWLENLKKSIEAKVAEDVAKGTREFEQEAR
jgi:hypothetical protein